MRPLSFRLSVSAALVSFGLVAAPDVSARGVAVTGARGGRVGLASPGFSVRSAGPQARRPGFGRADRPGIGPGGRFGYGFGDRDRFGRDGGRGYGFGRYGYGYGLFGSSPVFIGGNGQPRVSVGAEPGLPVATGIAPSPVLPPAIYVIGKPRPGTRS